MAVFTFEYQKLISDKELTPSFHHILTEARIATENAYAPYSNFRVGSAVLLENGEVVIGVNIENASYPVGICAERSALSSAISQYPDEKIVAIAISILAPSGENNTPAFPCGMCRQFISECEDRNDEKITLILAGQTGEVWLINSSKDLLPFSFGGSDLKQS
jgi:cytidine deaminase